MSSFSSQSSPRSLIVPTHESLQDIPAVSVGIPSKLVSAKPTTIRPLPCRKSFISGGQVLGLLLSPNQCVVPADLPELRTLELMLTQTRASLETGIECSAKAVPLIRGRAFQQPSKEIRLSAHSCFSWVDASRNSSPKELVAYSEETEDVSFQSYGAYQQAKRVPFQIDLKEATSRKTCNCKRSGCLKLYCVCFQSGGVCSPSCGCVNCQNRPGFEPEIQKARRFILLRKNRCDQARQAARGRQQASSTLQENDSQQLQANESQEEAAPSAPMMSPPSVGLKAYRGCNCKRSRCLKKYCECFARGQGCGSNCSCLNCLNTTEPRSLFLTTSCSTTTGIPDSQSGSPATENLPIAKLTTAFEALDDQKALNVGRLIKRQKKRLEKAM